MVADQDEARTIVTAEERAALARYRLCEAGDKTVYYAVNMNDCYGTAAEEEYKRGLAWKDADQAILANAFSRLCDRMCRMFGDSGA